MRHTQRVATAAAAAVCGAILLTPAGAAAAKGKSCNVKDLHYSYTKGTASYSDAVETLTAAGASCTSAQKVAGAVAKDLLHNTKVPGTISGLKVKVTNPCTGCTPLWGVTATGGGATVKFTVMGGAK
jgi:hypothetical protein